MYGELVQLDVFLAQGRLIAELDRALPGYTTLCCGQKALAVQIPFAPSRKAVTAFLVGDDAGEVAICAVNYGGAALIGRTNARSR